MPTYGYRCSTCGHEFERVQKMSDAPLTECEECSGPVKKILYPVGIAFKGSGFYVNDYKPGAGKSKIPAATASTDSTETKTDTSAAITPAAPATTESKPAEAPKTESKPTTG